MALFMYAKKTGSHVPVYVDNQGILTVALPAIQESDTNILRHICFNTIQTLQKKKYIKMWHGTGLNFKHSSNNKMKHWSGFWVTKFKWVGIQTANIVCQNYYGKLYLELHIDGCISVNTGHICVQQWFKPWFVFDYIRPISTMWWVATI